MRKLTPPIPCCSAQPRRVTVRLHVTSFKSYRWTHRTGTRCVGCQGTCVHGLLCAVKHVVTKQVSRGHIYVQSWITPVHITFFHVQTNWLLCYSIILIRAYGHRTEIVPSLEHVLALRITCHAILFVPRQSIPTSFSMCVRRCDMPKLDCTHWTCHVQSLAIFLTQVENAV